jgi:hypothetical protein
LKVTTLALEGVVKCCFFNYLTVGLMFSSGGFPFRRLLVSFTGEPRLADFFDGLTAVFYWEKNSSLITSRGIPRSSSFLFCSCAWPTRASRTLLFYWDSSTN